MIIRFSTGGEKNMKKALFGGIFLMAVVLSFTLSSVAADTIVCHIWPQKHFDCELRATTYHCCVMEKPNACPQPMDWYELTENECCDNCINVGAQYIGDHYGTACCWLP